MLATGSRIKPTATGPSTAGKKGGMGMKRHRPDTTEQPTSFANVTIVEEPLPPDDRTDCEQPTLAAELWIELRILEVPLPLRDALGDKTTEAAR
jgi:hypothetical protein